METSRYKTEYWVGLHENRKAMCFCKMNILLYGMKNMMPFKFLCSICSLHPTARRMLQIKIMVHPCIYSTHLKHKCQIKLVRIVQGFLKRSRLSRLLIYLVYQHLTFSGSPVSTAPPLLLLSPLDTSLLYEDGVFSSTTIPRVSPRRLAGRPSVEKHFIVA